MKTAILHYSAPPVIGGVEAVLQAHASLFAAAHLPLTVIAGRGEASALPDGVEFMHIPEMDSLHPDVARVTAALNAGQVPPTFEPLVDRLVDQLGPVLATFDALMVHNIFTKHFNLALTAALFRLKDQGILPRTLAWCHDLTWTSPHSRSQVYPAYPWDLLKTALPGVTYVAISQQRRQEVVDTFGCAPEQVPVVYNGVDARILLGLSQEGADLMDRLGLWSADIILLMPVRVTQAKNTELALRVAAELQALGRRPKVIQTGPPDPHDPDSMAYYETLRAQRRKLGAEDAMRFVFESGPQDSTGYTIDLGVVAELYRVADAMFMPSHREGFGMPVLEAGLVGLPVISTAIPAVNDLAREQVLLFSDQDDPAQLARRILAWLDARPENALRVKVRRRYTWQAIFGRDILPLLEPAGNQ